MAYNQHMPLPSFWLTRPPFDVDAHRETLEDLEQAGLASGLVHRPDTVPVWVLLCWLCDRRGYMAHGTGSGEITVFEPRQSNDVGDFGNRQAVYASSDGIWAMFFAIMNRPAVPMRVVNAAVTAHVDGQALPLYFFGASRHAVEHRAFRTGWVYLLPGHVFECEPGGEAFGVTYTSHHCASLDAVKPVFRVEVRPDDFPFLDRIHAYEDAQLDERSRRDPDSFPWLDD
ncbi:hypothetical protein E7T09_02720 [Deinococcus sp. KSM4-11]|uniref:hypothetical protein n=1 Tax=Deinococcus sp. KSM4-11 TaxID=2568654 RepID=UPI0010A39621|nr:hypothetical protein [Deinococcus sp. KSM4-11]THF88146.1 hypothetical protein E7T09_02720 [Deinococcus sp. KSM4-11]